MAVSEAIALTVFQILKIIAIHTETLFALVISSTKYFLDFFQSKQVKCTNGPPVLRLTSHTSQK